MTHDMPPSPSLVPAPDAGQPLLKEDGWYKIGFHRVIAGFFYNYVLVIFGAVVYIGVYGAVIPSLLGYPDVEGYYNIAKSLYALLFLLFDAGIGSAIGRFIPEYRVKDPRRALQYLSFFIWFQMITGLVQVTGIAIYVLYFIPPEMGHLAWIFLLFSLIQYPGMLNIMQSSLESYQHFSKYMIVAFVKEMVFQVIIEIACVLVGKWWGGTTPGVGEMMGITFGFVIGLYINEIATFLLAAKLFDNVLKGIGFRVMDCIRPSFTRAIAKECLLFGVKTLPASIYGTVLGLFSFFITFSRLPAYAAWMGLIMLAQTFTRQIDIGGQFATQTRYSITEAYLNGKERLAHYYLAMALKWRYYITLLFAMFITILVPPILVALLDLFGANFLKATPLIPILAIPQLIIMFEIPISITQLNRPLVDQTIGIVKATASFLWYLFLIYGLQTPLTIEIYILKDVPINVIFLLVPWVYVHKRFFRIHLRDFVVQTFLLPLLPTTFFFGFCYLYATAIFPAGSMVMGSIPFAVITLVVGFLVLPWAIFSPLMGFFGCWDDNTMLMFQEAVNMTGPSKFFMKLMFRTTRFGYQHSPLRGKFPVRGAEDAIREAEELMVIKRGQDRVNLKTQSYSGTKPKN